MGVKTEIESRTAALRSVLNSANAALIAKGGSAAANLSGISAAITALSTGGGGGAQVVDYNFTTAGPIQTTLPAGPAEVWGWGQNGVGWQSPVYLFLGNEYATYIGETPANPMTITIDGSGIVTGLPKTDAGKLIIVRR